MQAHHDFQSVRQERVDIRFWSEPVQRDNPSVSDQTKISASARNSTEAVNTQHQESLRKNIEFEVLLLKMLVERLTGKKIELINVEQRPGEEINLEQPETNRSTEPDWGLIMNSSTRVSETESMMFEASGIVQTADGRQIDISLALHLFSEFNYAESVTFRAGQALKDPLILNFSGSSVEISSDRFEFDLDVDGQVDQVPLLKSDSAFLALDNNRDGIINDGSELFGALSGNGFADLARHDEDGNGWIDERDSVFASLSLYQPGSDGKGQLISLSDKGVGALYLGNVKTDFRLADSDPRQLSGELKSTGLYLMESGEAGTLQQIDLAV